MNMNRSSPDAAAGPPPTPAREAKRQKQEFVTVETTTSTGTNGESADERQQEREVVVVDGGTVGQSQVNETLRPNPAMQIRGQDNVERARERSIKRRNQIVENELNALFPKNASAGEATMRPLEGRNEVVIDVDDDDSDVEVLSSSPTRRTTDGKPQTSPIVTQRNNNAAKQSSSWPPQTSKKSGKEECDSPVEFVKVTKTTETSAKKQQDNFCDLTKPSTVLDLTLNEESDSDEDTPIVVSSPPLKKKTSPPVVKKNKSSRRMEARESPPEKPSPSVRKSDVIVLDSPKKPSPAKIAPTTRKPQPIKPPPPPRETVARLPMKSAYDLEDDSSDDELLNRKPTFTPPDDRKPAAKPCLLLASTQKSDDLVSRKPRKLGTTTSSDKRLSPSNAAKTTKCPSPRVSTNAPTAKASSAQQPPTDLPPLMPRDRGASPSREQPPPLARAADGVGNLDEDESQRQEDFPEEERADNGNAGDAANLDEDGYERLEDFPQPERVGPYSYNEFVDLFERCEDQMTEYGFEEIEKGRLVTASNHMMDKNDTDEQGSAMYGRMKPKLIHVSPVRGSFDAEIRFFANRFPSLAAYTQ